MLVFFRISTFIVFISVSSFSYGEVITRTFSDPNFAACSGIGINASGSIEVRVEFERSSNRIFVKDLFVIGKYNTNFTFSATISYRDRDGEQIITLQEPWYPVISSAGNKVLTLPQIASTYSPGVDDKRVFNMNKPAVVQIKVYTIHQTSDGSCPSSFADSVHFG